MLSQLGIDVKAEGAYADDKEEEKNKENEKKKTETIIDKIPQHLTDIFDTLRTGFDDLIQVLTVKDPNQVSDIVNRHHNKIKAKNDIHRAEEQSKAAKEMQDASDFNGPGFNSGGDDNEIGPDEVPGGGQGSGLYRKLRRYGIGASGLLDDDQSEDEKVKDVDTDSPGEDDTVKGQYGNIQDNNASTAVREKKKERKGFFSAISNVPVIGAGINRLVAIANSIHDKVVGNGKEKKESLFSKLFKLIGIVGGGLFSIFGAGGGVIGKAISSIFGAGSTIGGFISKGLSAVGGFLGKGISALAGSPLGIGALIAGGGYLAYKYKDEIYDFISTCIIPPFTDAIKNSSIYKAIK
jgi:hypothetical protein